ncbi:MAG: hypothetical protein LBL62_02645 [Planctomycetaceae bacterium]|nr:hypothetical protein [Planctomycetaceae bacterium]
MNPINDGKWCCFPYWSQCKLNRRNRPTGGLPTSFRVENEVTSRLIFT